MAEQTTEDDVILSVRNLDVAFEMERGTSQVLDSVDFDINRQEILGIVGESGSGKSMFASALLDAVINPGKVSGKITYYPKDSEPVDVLELSDRELKQFRWEDISMVFQGAMSSWNPTMKIQDHFEETLRAHDTPIKAGMEQARQLLTDLYLDPERVLDSYPHELSGGMKQRGLIALSLVLEPEVLVMDEPTAALDLLMQRSILSLLAELQDTYDLTVIFITHDLPLVAGLADRMGVLYAFEFVEYGVTSDIIQHAAHPYTRALLRAAPRIDAPIDEMSAIEGESPDPVNTPQGCSYHPRCPLADNTCVQHDPEFHHVEEAHEAACFHWQEADEAVPYSIESSTAEDALALVDGQSTTRTKSETGDELVSLKDVEVHFLQGSFVDRVLSKDEIVRAVDGISFDIHENDVVALVGESGCGKTTLGKTAVGMQQPTGGSVNYHGQSIWEVKDGNGDASWEEIRQSLQMIHQDPGSSLNPNRIVLSLLSDPLKRWRPDLNADDREGFITRMLERIGMKPAEDYANRYPHQLSGGEQQRVALSRALLMSPDLILADEAVSALDVSLRIEMMDLMLELRELVDTAFLFIAHDLSNARYLTQKAGGRIGVMYLGKLVEIGPAKEVIRDPKHPYTQVLSWATPVLDPDMARKMRHEQPPVRSIDIPDPKNPPSGCRFHTRCPEAREVCTKQEPGLLTGEDGVEAACFRLDDSHEYWESEPLDSEEDSDRDQQRYP